MAGSICWDVDFYFFFAYFLANNRWEGIAWEEKNHKDIECVVGKQEKPGLGREDMGTRSRWILLGWEWCVQTVLKGWSWNCDSRKRGQGHRVPPERSETPERDWQGRRALGFLGWNNTELVPSLFSRKIKWEQHCLGQSFPIFGGKIRAALPGTIIPSFWCLCSRLGAPSTWRGVLCPRAFLPPRNSTWECFPSLCQVLLQEQGEAKAPRGLEEVGMSRKKEFQGNQAGIAALPSPELFAPQQAGAEHSQHSPAPLTSHWKCHFGAFTDSLHLQTLPYWSGICGQRSPLEGWQTQSWSDHSVQTGLPFRKVTFLYLNQLFHPGSCCRISEHPWIIPAHQQLLPSTSPLQFPCAWVNKRENSLLNLINNVHFKRFHWRLKWDWSSLNPAANTQPPNKNAALRNELLLPFKS